MLTGLCSRRATGKSEALRLEASRWPREPRLAAREIAAAHCRGGALARSWPTALPNRGADAWHLARGHECPASVLHSAPYVVAWAHTRPSFPNATRRKPTHPPHELPQASPGFICL